MFMGFILHIYIIFGPNLLTGGPTNIAVLLPVSVFQRKGISNGVQTEWNLQQHYFWEEYHPGDLEFTTEDPRGGQEIGGVPPLLGTPLSRGPLEHLLTDFFRLYKPTYPKNIKYHSRSGVPPSQAPVATKNQSGPCSGTLLEGDPSPEAIFIIPALSMTRRE